jgi:hypothetical protein
MFVCVAAATFALAVVGLFVRRAARAAHPTSTIAGPQWYRSLDEAQAVARRTGKLIFIDSGRLRCGNCRTLIGDVLPSPRVRDRMSRIAIGLSDEIDRPDPRVMQILESGIPNAQMLPLVGFVTPELRWVTGWSGFTNADTMCAHIAIAEQRWQLVQQKLRIGSSALPAPARPYSAEPKSVEPRPTVPAPIPRPVQPPHHDEKDCELPGRTGTATPSSPVTPPLPPQGEPTPQAVRPELPRTTPPAPVPPVARPPRRPRSPRRARRSRRRTRPRLARVRRSSLRRGHPHRRIETLSRPTAPSSTRHPRPRLGAREHGRAEAAARARRFPEAIRTLSVVQSELHDTQCPALTDAERGERAVRCLIAIERGSPDSTGTPEELRKQAYADFRGTHAVAGPVVSRSAPGRPPGRHPRSAFAPHARHRLPVVRAALRSRIMKPPTASRSSSLSRISSWPSATW